MTEKRKAVKPIVLTSHPSDGGYVAFPVTWGARDPKLRGPVVGTVSDPTKRNAIGVHSGSYGIYRALAIAAHELKADHRPDFTNPANYRPAASSARSSSCATSPSCYRASA